MTPTQQRLSMKAISYATQLMGTQEALGKLISVSQPTIHSWIAGEYTISGEYVIPVEKATNGKVTRHQLRPDLYPEEK